jgi:hypothetical protein
VIESNRRPNGRIFPVNEHRASISELLVKIEGEFDGMADDPSTTELACSRCAEHVNDLRSRSLRIGVTPMQLERLIHLVTRADCDANQSPCNANSAALSHSSRCSLCQRPICGSF